MSPTKRERPVIFLLTEQNQPPSISLSNLAEISRDDHDGVSQESFRSVVNPEKLWLGHLPGMRRVLERVGGFSREDKLFEVIFSNLEKLVIQVW